MWICPPNQSLCNSVMLLKMKNLHFQRKFKWKIVPFILDNANAGYSVIFWLSKVHVIKNVTWVKGTEEQSCRFIQKNHPNSSFTFSMITVHFKSPFRWEAWLCAILVAAGQATDKNHKSEWKWNRLNIEKQKSNTFLLALMCFWYFKKIMLIIIARSVDCFFFQLIDQKNKKIKRAFKRLEPSCNENNRQLIFFRSTTQLIYNRFQLWFSCQTAACWWIPC